MYKQIFINTRLYSISVSERINKSKLISYYAILQSVKYVYKMAADARRPLKATENTQRHFGITFQATYYYIRYSYAYCIQYLQSTTPRPSPQSAWRPALRPALLATAINRNAHFSRSYSISSSLRNRTTFSMYIDKSV